MKVLVTGGAGYIGSNLVDRLMDQDNEVFVVDNLTTGTIENIRHRLGDKNFHFVNDSILNEALMDRIIEKVDMVYHLAAVVGVLHVVKDPLNAILVNVKGSEIVLTTAFKYWKKVVLASSSEIYGKSPSVPFKEDTDRILGSTEVARWSYSTSKAIDEHFAFAYAQKGLPVAIVRYFNSYGPRIDEKGYGSVVAQFTRQALTGQPLTVHGDGKQSRCFTFIEDTLNGTLLAGTVPAGEGQVFNIGNNASASIMELAQTIRELCQSRSEIVLVPYESTFGKGFEDARQRVPSIERAREVLGFVPKVPLREGLQRTIQWCKENYKL